MKTNTREELTALFYKYSAADPNDKRYLDKFLDDLEALIEKEIQKEMERIISEVREANEFFDYYCDDSECCYGQVQSGIENKLAELEKEE